MIVGNKEKGFITTENTEPTEKIQIFLYSVISVVNFLKLPRGFDDPGDVALVGHLAEAKA